MYKINNPCYECESFARAACKNIQEERIGRAIKHHTRRIGLEKLIDIMHLTRGVWSWAVFSVVTAE